MQRAVALRDMPSPVDEAAAFDAINELCTKILTADSKIKGALGTPKKPAARILGEIRSTVLLLMRSLYLRLPEWVQCTVNAVRIAVPVCADEPSERLGDAGACASSSPGGA